MPPIKMQKSKLYIGTGSGGAVTVTAITKAFRAQVTGANTLTKGDRVTFATVGGMTEINGLVGTVLHATSTAFVVDIDTREFTTYTSGGTATPVEWTQVKGPTSIDWSPGGRADIDATDLDDDAEVIVPGVKRSGTYSFESNLLTDDPGQIACAAAYESGLSKSFKVVLSNGATRNFDAYVTNMPESGGVDTKASGSINLRITGDVVRA